MSRVYITGVGCITPLGNNVETLWNNIKNGACGIDFIKKIDASDLPVKIAAEVKDFHPEDYGLDKTMIRHNDLYALYALSAAAQAMADSGLKVGEDVDYTKNKVRVSVMVFGRPTPIELEFSEIEKER